jgi:hypothetical protein
MTDPLYVADLDTLKAKLRLTKLPADSAANDLLDESILDARVEFHRRLGATRVGQIGALAFVANPTTADEILRALANTVEVKLVRVRLMRTLPVLFQDSSGEANRAWDEEAPFREAGLSSLDKEIKRLEDEIEEAFQILEGEEQQGAEADWRVFDGTPDFCPPRPGDSVRPYGGTNQNELG